MKPILLFARRVSPYFAAVLTHDRIDAYACRYTAFELARMANTLSRAKQGTGTAIWGAWNAHRR